MSSKKNNTETVVSFYKKVIRSLAMESDENGLISMNLGGTLIPSTVNEKRLVLPTKQVLENPDWENTIGFHPLSENIYRGESEVLRKLSAMVGFRIMSVISLLLTELTEIASNQDLELTPPQAKLLDIIPRADKRTISDYNKIIDNCSLTGGNRIVSIFLKRGGKINGEAFTRAAIVSFPIMEQFDEEDRDVFGVNLRIKDYPALQALLTYVIKDADVTNVYSRGSRSLNVPYFDALMESYYAIATKLNSVSKVFKQCLSNYDEVHIKLDWHEEMEDISDYRNLIPALDGNTGLTVIEDEAAIAASATTASRDTTMASMLNKAADVANTTVNIHSHARTQPVKTYAGHAVVTEPYQSPVAPVDTRASQFIPPNEKVEESGTSWEEIKAAKLRAQYQQPVQQMIQQPQYCYPPQPVQVPQGFAGSTVNLNQPMQQQQGQYGYPQQNNNNRFGGNRGFNGGNSFTNTL